MSFNVPEKYRVRSGPYRSDEGYGNNGMFSIPSRKISASRRCATFLWTVIASDGAGWEHVSISHAVHVPSWAVMCRLKDLFWDAEDCVMQLHPEKSQYVNLHPNCLHLWRPVGIDIPRPPQILVGPEAKA